MAANPSDKDGGDKTQFGVAPPPQVKRTPQSEEKAAPDARPDHTQASGAPPPTPKSAAPATPGSESTGRPIAPPPNSPGAQGTGSVQIPAPPEADEEGTVILTRDRRVAATLQRVQPPGHSEVIHLDRTSYLAGRSHKCDLQLYSPSASREHARLTFRDAAWYVQPLGGKPVIADGVKVRDEQRLTHKMRLQFGGDELLFFDESAAASFPEARPATPTSKRPALVLLAVAAIVALGLAAWWLFFSGARLP